MKQIIQQFNDPLYRNSFFLMADTIVTSGLGFFFWMVVARFYTEAEVGLGAAIISAMLLLSLLARLGFGPALIRFLPKAEKPADMINSCFTLSGIVALALAAIFIIGINLWSPALGFIRENPVFPTAFAIFVLFLTFSEMMGAIFIANRRAEFVLSKNAIFSLLKIPLPIIMVLLSPAFGIVASWGNAIGVALVISLFLFLPRVQNVYKPMPKLSLGIIGNMWKYSAGSYLTSLFTTAPEMVLPIMIVNLLGAEHNAYFYVAWMIAGLLFAIPEAVSYSLFAEGSHFEDTLRVNVRRSFKFIFLLLIPAIILLFLLGRWLLLLFGGSYSINGLMLLWILGISTVFIGVNGVYSSILRVQGRVKELAIIFGFITTTVLVGSYFIIPTTGIIGVGYAWLAAQGIVCVYVLFAMRSSGRVRQVQRQ